MCLPCLLRVYCWCLFSSPCLPPCSSSLPASVVILLFKPIHRNYKQKHYSSCIVFTQHWASNYTHWWRGSVSFSVRLNLSQYSWLLVGVSQHLTRLRWTRVQLVQNLPKNLLLTVILKWVNRNLWDRNWVVKFVRGLWSCRYHLLLATFFINDAVG